MLSGEIIAHCISRHEANIENVNIEENRKLIWSESKYSSTIEVETFAKFVYSASAFNLPRIFPYRVHFV